MPVNLGATNRLVPPAIGNQGLFNPFGQQQQQMGDADMMIRNAMAMYGTPDISYLMGGNPGLARPMGPPPTGGLQPIPNAPIQTGGLQPTPNSGRMRNPILPFGGGPTLAGSAGTAIRNNLARPMGMGGAQNGSAISRPLFQGAGGVSTTRPDIALQPPRRQMSPNPWYGMYGTGM